MAEDRINTRRTRDPSHVHQRLTMSGPEAAEPAPELPRAPPPPNVTPARPLAGDATTAAAITAGQCVRPGETTTNDGFTTVSGDRGSTAINDGHEDSTRPHPPPLTSRNLFTEAVRRETEDSSQEGGENSRPPSPTTGGTGNSSVRGVMTSLLPLDSVYLPHTKGEPTGINTRPRCS